MGSKPAISGHHTSEESIDTRCLLPNLSPVVTLRRGFVTLAPLWVNRMIAAAALAITVALVSPEVGPAAIHTFATA